MIGGRFEFTIDPIKELDALKKSLRNKIMRKAMNKASGVVKNAVVEGAPARHGYLKKSQRIKIKHYKNGGVWLAVIGPKADFKKKKGKYKRGEKKGEPKIFQPSRYAHFLELGTKNMSARKYLKPALEKTKSQYTSILTQSIREQIEKELPKS